MDVTKPHSLLILILVLFGTAACGGPDDSDGGGDGDGPGAIVELLPEGYENVSAGRFNPDGTRLAMVASPPGEDEEPHLITTDLEGGDVEVLTTNGLSYLTMIAWMPDGESVLYGGGDGIMQAGLNGSEPTVVVDAFAVASVDVSSEGELVAWSTNGGMSVTTAPISAEPAATDEHISGPVGRTPRFSPDASEIAYVTTDGFGVSAPNGDAAQSIDAEVDYLSNVAWRDGETIVGLTDFGVTTFDVATAEATDVHEQFAAMELDVSSDGSMFVFAVNGQQTLHLGRF